jgi:gluconokinase
MGVSGSGKTTIGKRLSLVTGIPFFDADDWHPAANKEKMKAGLALDDEDRKEWLVQLNKLAIGQSHQKGAIIACSALKKKYRLQLEENIQSPVYWVLLEGNYELILARMQARKDHFMPPTLLATQFAILEKPEHALILDISKDPALLVEAICNKLQLPVLE